MWRNCCCLGWRIDGKKKSRELPYCNFIGFCDSKKELPQIFMCVCVGGWGLGGILTLLVTYQKPGRSSSSFHVKKHWGEVNLNRVRRMRMECLCVWCGGVLCLCVFCLFLLLLVLLSSRWTRLGVASVWHNRDCWAAGEERAVWSDLVLCLIKSDFFVFVCLVYSIPNHRPLLSPSSPPTHTPNHLGQAQLRPTSPTPTPYLRLFSQW